MSCNKFKNSNNFCHDVLIVRHTNNRALQIGEVREYLNEHEEDYEPDDDDNEEDTNHSSILLGATSPVSKRDLINSVPSRLDCDRLVSQWFNSQDPGNCKLPVLSKLPGRVN